MANSNNKQLIADIKPIPTKDRSNLGKVSLTLEQGTEVKIVGVTYGLEHQIEGEGFKATLFLDHFNQRIKIIKYEGENFEAMILKIRWLAEANRFDKITCMASRVDWQKFLRHGYVLEGVLKYYLNGQDAYIVSKFRSQERLISHNLMEEILLIEGILNTERDTKAKLDPPKDFQFRFAIRADIPELIALYKSIFETYPSPLVYSDYLESVFQKETVFVVATKDDHIVAAASGELYPHHKSVELTDCATHPSVRGAGLMSHLLRMLEAEVIRRQYNCSYTMARARSYGMNKVFYQLGYEFLGRLVNNCDIYGAYEDMNIWVKNIKELGN